MSEFTLKEMQVAKEIPGNPEAKGGPAKVYTLTLEEEGGTVRYAEMFATARTTLPNVGEKMKGEIDNSDTRYAPKWRPEGFQKGGGFRGGGRSPGETKAIQRQHSQEMALRYHDTLVRAGHRPMGLEQIHELTNWMEQDISGKQPQGITIDPLKDDVPDDTTDLEVKQSDGDAFP